MSVIIRLQNLPWSANALDIRNFFRGLSIPEGGVHIVGGELGDAFIAFSTDEDARQAMMLDGGKIKEIQVRLLLSSRSEMHKVIEAARQTVPLLSLAPPAPGPVAPAPVVPVPAPIAPVAPPAPSIPPVITPFSAALGSNPFSNFGIPGIGNPQEIPQPAVIELPSAQISPNDNSNQDVEDKEEDRTENKRSRDKDRRRSRSGSRNRDKKDRKKDRRDRSRSRDRRRRDRSRSRDRRDRKRDRKDRSRSRDRSPSRRSRDRRKSPTHSQDESPNRDLPYQPMPYNNPGNLPPQLQQMLQGNAAPPVPQDSPRYTDPAMTKMHELVKKRNPNAFQGAIDQNGGKQGPGRGGMSRGGFRREGRSRFDDQQQRQCCVAIRNAPNHTSYGDVRRFFPFMIDKHGIKMINDNMGRRTGNIYVRFCDGRSKQLALQRKNNELKGAIVSVEDLDDETYDAAVDSFLPYRENNAEEDADLLIADIQERSKPAYTILKLEDLPNFVKEHDIIKTFNNFSLLSITMHDCRMTRTKTAYVQFAKPEDAKVAYDERERYVFGKRQPTITSLTADEYEIIKNKGEKIDQIPQPLIRSEPPKEILIPRDPRQRRQQFDNGSGPNAGPPSLQNQNPPGAPFFMQPFPQNQGFQGGQFPGPQFGGFPGQPHMDPRTAASNWANRPSFAGQMEQLPALNKNMNAALPPSIEDEALDCVLMKGLPRDATDRTIVNFLSDTGAVPARIHLMLDVTGTPSGDCFCEFRSTQEARQAASKHGKNLEGLRVTVDLVPRTVVEEALEGPKTENLGPQDALMPEPLMSEPLMPDPLMPDRLMPNVPLPQFFEPQVARGGFNSRGSFRGRGSFDRGGFDRGGFNNNRGGFDSGRGNYRGRGSYDRGPPRGGYEARGRGRGRGGAGGMHQTSGYENGGRIDEQDSTLEDFGAPGCVVSMENVPFRATIEEILHFFSEFDLTQDDVIRRYNERGQPTGDARVAFRTPFDAQRAVKTRHMDTIHDRRINLNIL